MSPHRSAKPKLCDTVVMGITGSIGALWAAQFVLELRAGGHVREVRVVMSPSATQFVSPAAMRALSGTPVLSGLLDADAPLPVGHVQISANAGVMIVMPATANIIGKVANGIADEAVSASIMAAECPVVFVPNMNDRMWRRAAVQRNVRTLVSDGHHVVSPVAGTVVSTGRTATGGMPDFETVLKAVRTVVSARRRIRRGSGEGGR
jgi:phosphopantothenoylcysteine decarboxylase/phosphopantothenate--cysteine ligase